MAGTTWDVVILSSSPPAASPFPIPSPQNAAPLRRVAMPASSPPVLSPPASPKRPTAGASRSNARATAIPDGAVKGFATVSALVQSEYFAQQHNEDVAQSKQISHGQETPEGIGGAKVATRKVKKASTRRSTTDGSEESKPKPKPRVRKPKAKADQEDCAGDPELRLPAPTKSPFFGNDNAQPLTEPENRTENAAPKLTKAGKPRKPRAKKQNLEDGETAVVPKRRSTKAAKLDRLSKDGKLDVDAVPIVSAHFSHNAGEAAVQERATSTSIDHQKPGNDSIAIWESPHNVPSEKNVPLNNQPPDAASNDLAPEKAVVRRRDWTPPAEDNVIQASATDSTGQENVQAAANANGVFTDLVSNFAYARPSSAQTIATTTNTTEDVAATTKRRRVELIEINRNHNVSRNSSPEKGKAPKKKPRTITDLVIDQYTNKDQNSGPVDPTTKSLQPQTAITTKVPLNDIDAPDAGASSKKKSRKRTSPKSGADAQGVKPRPKRAAAKSKKAQAIVEKLLSPSTALSKWNKQKFLFGTSSQLALEESPVTIRELQFAIKASEQEGNVPPALKTDSSLRWPRLGKARGSKSHWAASARDEDGETLQHAKGVCMPEPDRTQDIPLLMDGACDDLDGQRAFIDIDDIDDIEPPTIPLKSAEPALLRPVSRGSQCITQEDEDYGTKDLTFADIDSFEQEPPPSNQKADLPNEFKDIDDFDFAPSAQTRIPSPLKPRPPASGTRITDGKPKKRRGRSPKSPSLVPAQSTSIPEIPAPKGKGKEISQAAPNTLSTPPRLLSRFIDIEEILDSEDEKLEALSPTPPRARKGIESPSLPLVSSTRSPTKVATRTTSEAATIPVFRIPSRNLLWENIKPQIFEQITAHIRSLAPTNDPKVPSWHEKILMYDPLVLEDFTAHLNTNTRVRTYRKATQKQIKAWNKTLKRDGDAPLSVDKSSDELLAVEKELEPFMAQGWCESLSVCCISAESRSKRGVRKGLY